MRAGRFGSKAGRVAIVVAFVLGAIVVGTTAASADQLVEKGDGVGRPVGSVSAELAETLGNEPKTLGNEWD
jgi:hypothetical protein